MRDNSHEGNGEANRPDSAGDQQAVSRNRRGQFVPGVSGNPAGRAEGSRNRATIALQTILQAEGEQVVRQAVTMALAGNEVALRLILERLLPVARERMISLDLPEVRKPEDVSDAVRHALEAVTSGEITPSEAETVLALLETLRLALVNKKYCEAEAKEAARFPWLHGEEAA